MKTIAGLFRLTSTTHDSSRAGCTRPFRLPGRGVQFWPLLSPIPACI